MMTSKMESGVAGDSERPVHPRLARIVTEVLAPAPTVAVLLLLVAWHSAPSTAEALRWGVLAALFPARRIRQIIKFV